MNIAAKFQFYPTYSFWGDGLLTFFHKINICIAMTTNRIEEFGLKRYVS